MPCTRRKNCQRDLSSSAFCLSFFVLYLGPPFFEQGVSVHVLFSHHECVDHPDLDQAIDGRGLRCIERKGRMEPAATLGDDGWATYGVNLSLRQLSRVSEASSSSTSRLVASIRQWTCSGAWPIFVLTLTILSHTGTRPSSVHPTKCWNLSPVCPPSLVLSETPSSASLQNKREVASISGYASLVPLVSVSELASKVSSVRPKVRRPLFNRRDNLRVCESASEGSSGNGSLPSPSHERQANAKHDDVRPVLPLPSPRLRDGLSDTHSGDPFSKPDMRAAILPLCCKFHWRLKGCHRQGDSQR